MITPLLHLTPHSTSPSTSHLTPPHPPPHTLTPPHTLLTAVTSAAPRPTDCFAAQTGWEPGAHAYPIGGGEEKGGEGRAGEGRGGEGIGGEARGGEGRGRGGEGRDTIAHYTGDTVHIRTKLQTFPCVRRQPKHCSHTQRTCLYDVSGCCLL